MKKSAESAADAQQKSVKERLQADILSGRFRPGEWLKQVDLETAYDANRFEVRIALSEIAARHLIDHIPNRGYRVVDPSNSERAELYEVRTILETGAARLTVQRVTEQDIAELEELVEAFANAMETQSRRELVALNMQFHNRLYQICGNKLLVAQIQELRERGIPGRRGGWDTNAGVRASYEDHARMVEMLKAKDADGLSYVVYHHLNRWREFTQPS